MNLRKILRFICGDKFNENPLPIIDSYIKEHGLTLLPHSTKDNYIIDGFKKETDKLFNVSYDEDDGSIFCAVIPKRYDYLLQHGFVNDVNKIIEFLDTM